MSPIELAEEVRRRLKANADPKFREGLVCFFKEPVDPYGVRTPQVRRMALINTNRVQPPIAPIGLDYLAEVLNAAGHGLDLWDLCGAPPAKARKASFAPSSRATSALIGAFWASR